MLEQETEKSGTILQYWSKWIVSPIPSLPLPSLLTAMVHSPIYTLFFPFRIMPYTDGRSWARREGYERHRGVREGEELTDEEDDDE